MAPSSFIRVWASWNTLRYDEVTAAPTVTPTAMSPSAMGYPFAIGLHLCLWAGLCVLMWDADNVGVTLLVAYLVSLILGLPVAFCVGILLRYAELVRDTVTWVGDRWRYRRRAP